MPSPKDLDEEIEKDMDLDGLDSQARAIHVDSAHIKLWRVYATPPSGPEGSLLGRYMNALYVGERIQSLPSREAAEQPYAREGGLWGKGRRGRFG